MRNHEARANADTTRAQHDHDTSTRAIGRTTLTAQLAYDDDDRMFSGVPWGSIGADDADSSDGDSLEGGPIKVEGGGSTPEAPEGEHDKGAGHGERAGHGEGGDRAASGEPDADGDATEADGAEPPGGERGERDASHVAE